MNISRRGMLSGGLAGAGVSVLGACSSARQPDPTPTATPSAPLPQKATPASWGAGRNRRQSGVTGFPGTHGYWLGANLSDSATKDDLRRALVVISDAAARLVDGGVPLTDQATEMAAKEGEIAVTVGLGPDVFALEGMPKPPRWLKPLPKFSIDKFEKPWSQTDLIIQVCGDDPLRTSHAAEQLGANLKGIATVAWRQHGSRPVPAEGDRGIVRNHFGQLDGQVNPSGTGGEADIVWNSASAAQPWLQDTTGLVIRRIRMDVETWDSLDREARENSIGRRLSNGAPLTSNSINEPMDTKKTDELGLPVINPASHVPRAMAAPGKPQERIRRRPYNYERETDDGKLDKGLIFVAFCADVEAQFTPIQKRLAEGDILNTWTTPIGSGVYFVPQAPMPGEYVGQTVLEA